MYHGLRSPPGVSGIVMAAELKETYLHFPFPPETRPLNSGDLESFFRKYKYHIISSLPISADFLHGPGVYDALPAMGIFAISTTEFKPFLGEFPNFDSLIFTDEAGLMIEWLKQTRESGTAWAFVTTPRTAEAWSPMLMLFQYLVRMYGDPKTQTACWLKLNQGAIDETKVEMPWLREYETLVNKHVSRRGVKLF
jgi:hypothetical protein